MEKLTCPHCRATLVQINNKTFKCFSLYEYEKTPNKEDWVAEPCYLITIDEDGEVESFNIGEYKVNNHFHKGRSRSIPDFCIVSFEGTDIVRLKQTVPTGTLWEVLNNLCNKGQALLGI